MRKLCVLAVFMISAAALALPAQAQTHNHGAVPAKAASAESPGHSWRQVEENMRNLNDAAKTGDLSAISNYTQSISEAVNKLMAANIQEEVKPQEKDHLILSLQTLRDAVDKLLEANIGGDKAAIDEAISQVSGAVTLTRIDVPPGLLERISGAAVRAEIVNTPMLAKGQKATVTLRLKSAVSGKPLTPDDLSEVHTKKVHALVIDPQLKDYTHAHPVAIDVPGEYTFSLTPQTDCTYRLWADVTPIKGAQEYAVVDIPGKEGCGTLAIDDAESLSASVEGFTLNLMLPDGGLAVGKEETLSFEVLGESGEPVTGLEPLMGAYAHVVGFYEDYRTIAHLHPLGTEPKTPEDRGSSPLSFHFKPEKSGVVKLYVQIQVAGAVHVFPLSINVQP